MTYKELIDIMQIVGSLVGDATTKEQKKLAKINEKLKPYYEEWVDKRNDLRLDAASVDDKGNVILDSKGDYSFTKEAIKKLNADLKELMNTEFSFKKINVFNSAGLEYFGFLANVVDGVEFKSQEDDDEAI